MVHVRANKMPVCVFVRWNNITRILKVAATTRLSLHVAAAINGVI